LGCQVYARLTQLEVASFAHFGSAEPLWSLAVPSPSFVNSWDPTEIGSLDALFFCCGILCGPVLGVAGISDCCRDHSFVHLTPRRWQAILREVSETPNFQAACGRVMLRRGCRQ